MPCDREVAPEDAERQRKRFYEQNPGATPELFDAAQKDAEDLFTGEYWYRF